MITDIEKQKITKFFFDHGHFFKKPLTWFLDNWHIVNEFENIALDIIFTGRDHYSARTIVEVLVHESILKEKGGVYKIGNDNAPDLARIFVVLHPEYVNFWEYRRSDYKEFIDTVSVL